MGQPHPTNSGDREDYLDFYRKWIADARAVSEEIGEPMELVMPLLCVNTVITKMADCTRFLVASVSNPELVELQKKALSEIVKDCDEPWKEGGDLNG